MSDTAQLKSIEALRDFRMRLLEFQASATGALESIGQQVQRSSQWLEQDRPLFWKNEVLRGSDRVAEARVALAQCRLRRIDGEPPSCFDEQKALAAAKHRLAVAERKVVEVKRWRQEVAHEALEMAGRTGQLQDALQADIPKAVASLERIMASVQSYLDVPIETGTASTPSGTPDNSEPLAPKRTN